MGRGGGMLQDCVCESIVLRGEPCEQPCWRANDTHAEGLDIASSGRLKIPMGRLGKAYGRTQNNMMKCRACSAFECTCHSSSCVSQLRLHIC